MPAPPVLPALLLALAIGVLAGAMAVRRHGRARRRTREFWHGMLEQVGQVYGRCVAGQTLGACVLRTGYVVGDERSARALAGWLCARPGQGAQVRKEDDPTFGAYWVVEANIEVRATPDLPMRWVAMMREACRHGASGIEHCSLFVLADPPTDEGGVPSQR